MINKIDTHICTVGLKLGIETFGYANTSRFHHTFAAFRQQEGTNDMVRLGIPHQLVGGIPQLFLCMFQILERNAFVECRLAAGEEMDTPAVGHETMEGILFGAYVTFDVVNPHLLGKVLVGERISIEIPANAAGLLEK